MLIDEKDDHCFLFVTESGTPRKEVSYLLRSIQQLYLAKSAPGHSFRHSQASLSATIGQTDEEKSAMAASRQHTVATSDSVYTHANRKRQAEVASSHLERLRQATASSRVLNKRQRTSQPPLDDQDQNMFLPENTHSSKAQKASIKEETAAAAVLSDGTAPSIRSAETQTSIKEEDMAAMKAEPRIVEKPATTPNKGQISQRVVIVLD